jgi:hypothetical protein
VKQKEPLWWAWHDQTPKQPVTNEVVLPAGADASFEENDAMTDASLRHRRNKLGACLNG